MAGDCRRENRGTLLAPQELHRERSAEALFLILALIKVTLVAHDGKSAAAHGVRMCMPDSMSVLRPAPLVWRVS